MTEKKRFEFYSDEYLVGIIDTVTGKKLNHFATIDLLNEQRDQIINMKKEFEKFKEENERLKLELNNCEKNCYNNIFEKMNKNHQNNAVTLKDVEKSIGSERYYIHCGDDINKQLFDTESDFNIHIEEICSDEELIELCNRLNEQQDIITKLKELNDDKGKRIISLIRIIKTLKEENEQLKKRKQY